MEEHLIECLADDMLFEHGLTDWTFEFDRAKVRLGACHYRTKTITLSRPLCEWASEAEITDTLLHEIAHAIAGGQAGHGTEWRRVALSIGCSGERCHTMDTREDARYVMYCPGCNDKKAWHRRPKDYVRVCHKCGTHYRSTF